MGTSLFLLLLVWAVPARSEEPPPATSPGPPDPSRGWIGVGGRNAFGVSPVDPDFGVYAYGGLWLLGEHLQPFVRAGWSHAGHGPGPGVTVDAVRTAAGLALGTSFARERLWLGGALGAELIGAFEHGDEPAATTWGVAFPLAALVQARIGERLLIGVDAGPELSPMSMRFPGNGQSLEWGVLRFNAGLVIGVTLGRPLGR
jgi:hypothetical protein